jgi:hypothetical protein
MLNAKPTTKAKNFPEQKKRKSTMSKQMMQNFDKQNFLDVYARKWQRKLFIQT